jgi:hypothetical protein
MGHGHKGISPQLHYLDDFLFLGSPQDIARATALQQALDMCEHLGVPVAAHKTKGPATQLPF